MDEKNTVTRIVRGPGRYLHCKKGERVEVPVSWIGNEPTVEQCTMSLEEAGEVAKAKAEALAVPKETTGGLKDVAAKFYESATAQLDAKKRAVKKKRGEK